ncbi:Transposase [Phytophthora megakarya]|uniref:Transposase n=1 Tax=Phytophthora megakarya TaxID=4795 RepID=A0A225VPX6_9STRA|nr:Transposase [Phytophthora megakarya]
MCCALNFDLNISRKVLYKAAREAIPAEIRIYKKKLLPLYSYAEQLVFLDETSKDGKHAFRLYAWSRRNTKIIVRLPFSRGKRLSVMAVLDVTGFRGWE